MKVLSFRDLREVKGINFCRVHVARLVKAGEFPAPLKIGARRIGWVEAEVDAFLKARAAEREPRRVRA
jgi:prophage regulatory protein